MNGQMGAKKAVEHVVFAPVAVHCCYVVLSADEVDDVVMLQRRTSAALIGRIAPARSFVHPHLHSGPDCRVCAALSPRIDATYPTPSSTFSPAAPSPAPVPSSSSSKHRQPPPASHHITGGASMISLREAGLREWMTLVGLESRRSASAVRDDVCDALIRSIHAGTQSGSLTEEMYDELVTYLTSFTQIPQHTPASCTKSTACSPPGSDTHRGGIGVGGAPIAGAAAVPLQRTTLSGRVLTVDAADVKQQTFFVTLRDFVSQARLALPLLFPSDNPPRLFACCGTALGFHREGRFLPHDADIDLGVSYSALASAGRRHNTAEARLMTDHDGASEAVLALLSQLALSETFVSLDVCGTIEKGLEIRFQHAQTGVLLDLNVYYPSLPSDHPPNSNTPPFVWCATYYAEASKRLHNMYRYRHAPFEDQLMPVQLSSSSSSSGGGHHHHQTTNQDDGAVILSVPPEAYLNEYFGDDWRTPRIYSYEEGLRSEYRNIIPE